jgi:hypothetical protein
MRKMSTVVPMLFPVFALSVAGVGLATSQAGCSSSSSPASPDKDSGAEAMDSAPPVPDSAPPVLDAATCDQHLPAGFTNVVSSATDTDLGSEASMVLDENDDPMFAYLVFGADDTTLQFVRWDRCAGAFTAPVTVDTVNVDSSSSARDISLGYDPSTKEVAVAYKKIVADPGYNDAATIWLASEKSGDTSFATQMVSEGEAGDVRSAGTPSLAMSGGKLYIAYAQDNYLCGAGGSCVGLWFLESATPDADASADDAGSPGPHFFTRSTVQYGNNPAQPRFDGISVAVDSTGTPAVAFYQEPESGYDTALLFWRKGMVDAVMATDSNDVQNDDVDLTLRFEGTKPRVAGHLSADDPSNYDLTYVTSDDGSTWFAPVRLPRDGTAGTAFTSALAFDGMGNVAVAADTNSGSGDNVCGNPYLARSSNGTSWTACGADTTKTRNWKVGGLNAAYGSSRLKGKLALGFHNGSIEQELAGVVYWQDQ